MVFVLAFDSQINNILCGDIYRKLYVNAHTIMQTECICIHRNTVYEHAHKYSMHMSTGHTDTQGTEMILFQRAQSHPGGQLHVLKLEPSVEGMQNTEQ